jgi:lysophospholipase L1-like esterase
MKYAIIFRNEDYMFKRNKIKIMTITFAMIFIFVFAFPSTVFADQNSGVEGFVTRLYETCLGREPDPAGFESWVNNLVTEKVSGGQAAYGFMFSEELINRNLNNDEFLVIMYKAFFDRPSDPGGYANWMGLLNSGSSREFVFSNFVNSTEFSNICAQYGIQAGTVNVSGSSGAVSRSAAGNTIVVMGDSLINMSDWVQRFGTIINSKFPASGYNTIGSAVNGEMAFQGVSRFDSTVASQNPRIIIIAYGTNDIGSSPDRFQSSMEQLVVKSKNIGATVFFNLVGPIYHSGKQDWPAFNQIIMGIAAKYGIRVIDVSGPLSQNPGVYLIEGMHYSPAGAGVVAQSAFNVVSQYLK